MALVVLLKGINVGGHKTFRPTVLAKELARFDIVNIGAAGTFVVRGRVPRAKLREAVIRCLPFAAEVIICNGKDILRLTSGNPFADLPIGPDTVPFVSVLARRHQPVAPLPLTLPPSGDWGVKILSQEGQLVCGVYRRQMKAISYLRQLESVFRVAVTTRNWNTIQAIARVLAA